MEEQWSPVNGFAGLYEVSNLGRVRSLDIIVKNRYGTRPRKGRILSLIKDHYGYLFVTLSRDDKNTVKKVHRLVGEQFLVRCDEHTQINHLDMNKMNNVVTNLEWCTHLRNSQHAAKKLSPELADAIRAARASGLKYRVIAELFCIHTSTAINIVNGKLWVTAPIRK